MKVKIRFLSAKLLTMETIQKLKESLENYDYWIATVEREDKENREEYFKQFCEYACDYDGDDDDLLHPTSASEGKK